MTIRELHTALTTADAICIRDGVVVELLIEETLSSSIKGQVRSFLLTAVDTDAPASSAVLARGGHKYLL